MSNKTVKDKYIRKKISSDAVVKALLPADPSIRNYIVFDTEFKMFGVRVSSKGLKRYIVRVKSPSGSYSVKNIADVSAMSATKAREHAREIFDQKKVDLSKHTKSEGKDLTFKDLTKLYLAGHAKTKKKDKSLYEDEMRLKDDKIIMQHLAHKYIVQITRGDILAIHEAKVDTPYEANRIIALLSKMFNYAIVDRQLVDITNPCKGIKKYKEHGKQNIPEKDVQRFFLDILNASPEVAAYACRLRFYTGARVVEAMGAKKSEFEFKTVKYKCEETGKMLDRRVGLWCIPHERMKTNKDEVKVLPEGCVNMLEHYMKYVDGDYMFPGATGQPIKSTKTFFNTLRKKVSLLYSMKQRFIKYCGADQPEVGIAEFEKFYNDFQLYKRTLGATFRMKGLEYWYHLKFREYPTAEMMNVFKSVRQYDIRHMFATELASAGVPLHVLKDMMGHSTIKVTEKYLHNLKGEKENAASIIDKAFSAG